MKPIAENKRARFDYEILETFEAGLVLEGKEVKSIKTGHLSLSASFVSAHNNELYLINANIPLYKHAGTVPGYDPTRSRKLLLHKKEITYLLGKIQAQGLTLVPLSVYNKKRHIKLFFALAKGKKKYDKRESIKKREAKVDIARTIRQGH